VRPASQLIEQGIKAYTRGLLDEAQRCWQEALSLEPLNDRAKAYLDLLAGARSAPGVPVPVPAIPLPVPQPEALQDDLVRDGDEGPAVPLPAPAAPPRGKRPTLSEYAPSPWDQGPATAPAIVLETDGGVDLETLAEKSDLRPLVPEQPSSTPAPMPPVNDVEVWMHGAKELHALGDFSGSLEMIEKILKVDPEHAEARAYLNENESTLIAMNESKLGSMGSIPRLAIKPEEVLWLNLDHRAGFLLAQIDGSVTFEDLFALSGLPRLDTARILAMLLQEGVIAS
jgi:tetratricopeptide (TPR) repeat protein